MGVFARILDLSKAAANEALNKLEDPVMMLNHYLRSMKEEMGAVERNLSKQTATERVLKQRIDEYNQLAADWERKAADLVASGLEAEARQALSTKLYYVDKGLECAEQYGAARLHTEELTQQLERIKSEYGVMQQKRAELAARAQKMASQQAKSSAAAGHYRFEGGYAASGFQRIEEKIMQWEAQTELLGQSYGREQQPFTASAADHLSEASRDARIEEQLARLKQQSPAKEQ